MVCGFFREHGCKRGVLGGKGNFRFRFLSGRREFSGVGQFGNDWRSCRDEAGTTPDDPANGAVLFGAGDVLVLRLPVIVGEKVSVGDGVYVNVSQGFNRGSDEVGFVAFGVGGEG